MPINVDLAWHIVCALACYFLWPPFLTSFMLFNLFLTFATVALGGILENIGDRFRPSMVGRFSHLGRILDSFKKDEETEIRGMFY